MIWYPPYDWIEYKSVTTLYNEPNKYKQYIRMLYNAVLILGSNELGPVNIIESIYITLTLLFSTLLNVLIFGDIAVILDSLSRNNQMYQRRLDEINHVMALIEVQEDF